MDKDTILKILKKYHTNSLSQSEAWDIIERYCIERGKEDNAELLFFLNLCCNLQLFPLMLNDVFSYYKRSLGLTELYKITPQGKEIILIY